MSETVWVKCSVNCHQSYGDNMHRTTTRHTAMTTGRRLVIVAWRTDGRKWCEWDKQRVYLYSPCSLSITVHHPRYLTVSHLFICLFIACCEQTTQLEVLSLLAECQPEGFVLLLLIPPRMIASPTKCRPSQLPIQPFTLPPRPSRLLFSPQFLGQMNSTRIIITG